MFTLGSCTTQIKFSGSCSLHCVARHQLAGNAAIESLTDFIMCWVDSHYVTSDVPAAACGLPLLLLLLLVLVLWPTAEPELVSAA